jgi:hypothetical protein
MLSPELVTYSLDSRWFGAGIAPSAILPYIAGNAGRETIALSYRSWVSPKRCRRDSEQAARQIEGRLGGQIRPRVERSAPRRHRRTSKSISVTRRLRRDTENEQAARESGSPWSGCQAAFRRAAPPPTAKSSEAHAERKVSGMIWAALRPAQSRRGTFSIARRCAIASRALASA